MFNTFLQMYTDQNKTLSKQVIISTLARKKIINHFGMYYYVNVWCQVRCLVIDCCNVFAKRRKYRSKEFMCINNLLRKEKYT